MARTRAIFMTAIGIAVLVVVGLAWLASDWLDPFDDQRFRPGAWAKTRSATGPQAPTAGIDFESRAPMARDLIRNHLSHGTPQAEVVALLGRPDKVITGTDAGGNRLRGSQTYSYYIGSWSSYFLDDAFVYVHFDASGRVVAAEIEGY